MDLHTFISSRMMFGMLATIAAEYSPAVTPLLGMNLKRIKIPTSGAKRAMYKVDMHFIAMSTLYIALFAPLVGIFFLIKFIPRRGVTAGLYSAAMVTSIPNIILEDMKVCTSTCAARPSSIFT